MRLLFSASVGALIAVTATTLVQAQNTPVEPNELEKARYLTNLALTWMERAERDGIPMNKGELKEVLEISELIWKHEGGIHPEGVSEFDQVYSALIRGHLLWANLNRAGHTKNEIEWVKKAYRWLPELEAFVEENGA